ncbi:hypothetical protein H2198_009012 [Neophaeococcomyces mojaviensis]|uniref:Uncharacterized protein n=1 Tax=Neophaeococcomyces mojaviensis TaxID=3383035 RepID=A0ACC2ZVW2_9EURO|nr:hypothetical protein H2198_009012 [Knufia sp. JES_112]
MSKPSSKKNQQPKDVSQYWAARGYRPDIAALKPAPDEDPKGEGAYQRAFHEEARSDPPRLPNASHYPNSPSAREYIRKKSSNFLAPRVEKRPGEDNAEGQVSRRLRDPDRSPMLPDNKSSSTSPVSAYSQNAALPLSSQYDQKPNIQFAFQRPPAFLEPSGAPMGPVNKLR